MTSSMKHFALTALLAGAAFVPFAAAHAESAATPAEPTVRKQEMTVQGAFDMVDANGSKSIEKREYDIFAENQGRAGIRLSKSFTNLDANNDGILSIEEFSKQSVVQ